MCSSQRGEVASGKSTRCRQARFGFRCENTACLSATELKIVQQVRPVIKTDRVTVLELFIPDEKLFVLSMIFLPAESLFVRRQVQIGEEQRVEDNAAEGFPADRLLPESVRTTIHTQLQGVQGGPETDSSAVWWVCRSCECCLRRSFSPPHD